MLTEMLKHRVCEGLPGQMQGFKALNGVEACCAGQQKLEWRWAETVSSPGRACPSGSEAAWALAQAAARALVEDCLRYLGGGPAHTLLALEGALQVPSSQACLLSHDVAALHGC